MKYSDLCEVYEELQKNPSRLKKTEILAEFLKKLKHSNHLQVIYLLQGKAFPDYSEKEFGISEQLCIKSLVKSSGVSKEKIVSAWKKTGDLGDVAESVIKSKKQNTLFSKNLTTEKVLVNLQKLPELEGRGTIDKKISLISELLTSATGIEAKYVIRTLLNSLRIGVASGTIRDAIVEACFKPEDMKNSRTHKFRGGVGWNTQEYIDNAQWHNDKGGASRFFYTSKAHKSERNAGLDTLEDVRRVEFGGSADFCLKCGKRKDYNCNCNAGYEFREQPGQVKTTKNDIATLKPINLMRYLVRLVCPKGGIELDPFGGSGTTGIACIIEGMDYILIEKRKRFAEKIIPLRLKWWSDPSNWSILQDHPLLPKTEQIKNEIENESLAKWLVSEKIEVK